MRQAALVEQTIAADGRDPARELRNEQRCQLDCAARLTVIGPPARILHGEVRNLSQGGTQIRLNQHVPPFTLVKIEYNDSLLLGEVVYSQQEPSSSWLTGVRVEHGLFGLEALADVMRAF